MRYVFICSCFSERVSDLNAVKEEKSKKGLLSYHYKVSFEEYLVADRGKKHISLIKSILNLNSEYM